MIKNLGDKSKFSNPQTERLILSLCMKDYEIFLEASTQVDETDFLTDAHAEMLSILKSLSDDKVKEFDIHTVISRAEARGTLADIGGYKYLAAVKDMITSRENLQAYIKELLDRSYKRKLYVELNSLKDELEKSVGSEEEGSDFFSLASAAETKIVDLYSSSTKLDDPVLLSEGLSERLESFREHNDIVVGMRSGMPIFDKYVRGFQPGALYVVAARPKTGKSTLLMNWALNILQANKDVSLLYCDTEMLTSEIQTRAVSNLSLVNEESLLSGDYAKNDMQFRAVMNALEKLGDMQYYHKYTPRFEMSEIRRLAKKYKHMHDIDILFFDYIKLSGSLDGSINETQYLGLLTSTLKDLAGELEIPVVTAAQLGRVADNRKFISSTMVGESDRILRYCNVLMGLAWKTKEEIDEGGGPSYCGTHRLQILENRGGNSLRNGIDIGFRPYILKMEEAENQSEGFLMEDRENTAMRLG